HSAALHARRSEDRRAGRRTHQPGVSREAVARGRHLPIKPLQRPTGWPAGSTALQTAPPVSTVPLEAVEHSFFQRLHIKVTINESIDTELVMLKQIPDQHVVLEVLVASAVARIRFPHPAPGLVIDSRATGDVLGIPLFLPRRHGKVAPIPEPFPHPEVSDFVS